MKNLCITTFVFGKKHREYIPLYIYSILKSYKDYYPLIFLQSSLSDTVCRQLDIIKELGEFKVVENYLNSYNLKNQQGKAARWILDEPEFQKFQAVYIGDIDIFILPEEPGIYQQHITHCETIKLPYSNAMRPVRKKTFTHSLRKLPKVCLELGPISTIRFLFKNGHDIKRLSGLQFVKTDEYFKRIRPLIPKYKNLILDNSYQNRHETAHHDSGFHNESVLYDMMAEAGMELESQGQYSIDYNDYTLFAFRPHHGLHLRLFRNDKGIRNNSAILNSTVYKYYYKKFRDMTDNDPIFNEMQKQFSIDLKNLFARLLQYYR